MKVSSSQALVAALIPLASAFPAAVFKAAQDPELVARARAAIGKRVPSVDGATALFEPINTFDASKQYIDVSEGSGHEYVAPGPDDIRGPCPGLNAFANHGFLPHDGYATITQFTDATENVVGMGPTLAIFLAALGASIDGDGTAWSIGGTPTAAQAGALGTQGNGISGSHNKYESDASPTRPDLYEAGNDYMTVASQFQQLIDASPGSVTLDSLTAFRSQRFDTQIANNPYFFNGPFTGVLVQPAAYTFIFRFMANHSSENPTGLLNYDVLASWFGIQGTSGSYTAAQGTERIPDNWYRRALEYPYDNPYFLADVANAAVAYPKFLDIGGNTGTTNSFAGVDVSNFTGGLINSGNLAEGDNFACLAYEFAAQAKPDLVLSELTQLTDALGTITSALSCPQLETFDENQLKTFPGYAKAPANV